MFEFFGAVSVFIFFGIIFGLIAKGLFGSLPDWFLIGLFVFCLIGSIVALIFGL